ncbi:polysaccharide biosynthesis/export family protein, partial [bacterium]|nr:polysaccharide biosynthesis/export family protein [bacterium]
MTRFLKIIIIVNLLGMLLSCSQVLQTVELKLNTEDKSTQEKFNVVEKTLTSKEARKQNKSSYRRELLQPGRGNNAQSIPERIVMTSNFPESKKLSVYKIGIGDQLSFSRLFENKNSEPEKENQWPIEISNLTYKLGIGDTLALTLVKETQKNIATPTNTGAGQNLIINSQLSDVTLVSQGRIGSDGSVLLLEIGRLEANGKSLNELRAEVRNILIRNGVSPRFQLEIVEFLSQNAYLTVNELSIRIPLIDQSVTLKDVLVGSRIGIRPGVITRVRLQRSGNEYVMSLRDIFNENAPDVLIQSLDHIFVENSPASIIETVSTVDYEGNVVFPDVGKIKVAGLSLDEVKNTIEARIQQIPNSQNA